MSLSFRQARGPQSHTRPWILSFVVALIAVIAPFAGGVGHVAHAESRLVLDHGHADIFDVSVVDGTLDLKIKEDVTGHGVLREPEDVLLHVKSTALKDLSGDFSRFGSTGYVLPLVQDQDLLWPGWDTQKVTAAGLSAVDIVFEEVSGPGKVYVFTQGSGLTGGIAPLLVGDSFEVTSGSIRRQDPPAHTHAYWVFSAAGSYTMKVKVTAGGASSRTATYSWQVGELSSTGGASSNDNTDTTTTTTPTTSRSTQSSTSSVTRNIVRNNLLAIDDPWLNAPAKIYTRKRHAPEAGSALSSGFSSGPMVGEPSPAPRPAGAAPTVVSSTPAPAAPAPAPAVNEVCRAESTTSAVPQLVPVIRDDRVAPARLVDPESLTFIVGSAAAATTTTAIGSIGSGQRVWMIGSTQVPNVPWLGVNTMSPELVGYTTGAIDFALTGFTGPGNLEVFESGNFGQIVGNRWFAATPGSASGSIAINPNTHVHPNWVFSAPGRYTVTITQTATTTAGESVSAPTTLKFVVGDGASAPGEVTATQGHFDLGSTVRQGSATTTRYVNDRGEACTPQAVTGTQVGASHAATPADNQDQGGAAAPAPAAAKDHNRGLLAATGVDGMIVSALIAALGFVALGLAFARRGRSL